MTGLRIPAKLAAVTVLVIGYVVASETIPLLVNTGPICERAATYIAAHAAQLPETYDEIRAFPRGYRPYLFARLSPSQKSAVVRDHLHRYLIDHEGKLSSEQLAFVHELYAFAQPNVWQTPEVFAEQLQDHKTRAVEIFGRARAFDLGADFGDGAVALADLLSRPVLVAEWAREKARRAADHFIAAAQTYQCTCSTTDDWCSPYPTSPDRTCITPPTGCIFTPFGCGWFFAQPCTGMCTV